MRGGGGGAGEARLRTAEARQSRVRHASATAPLLQPPPFAVYRQRRCRLGLLPPCFARFQEGFFFVLLGRSLCFFVVVLCASSFVVLCVSCFFFLLLPPASASRFFLVLPRRFFLVCFLLLRRVSARAGPGPVASLNAILNAADECNVSWAHATVGTLLRKFIRVIWCLFGNFARARASASVVFVGRCGATRGVLAAGRAASLSPPGWPRAPRSTCFFRVVFRWTVRAPHAKQTARIAYRAAAPAPP